MRPSVLLIRIIKDYNPRVLLKVFLLPIVGELCYKYSSFDIMVDNPLIYKKWDSRLK